MKKIHTVILKELDEIELEIATLEKSIETVTKKLLDNYKELPFITRESLSYWLSSNRAKLKRFKERKRLIEVEYTVLEIKASKPSKRPDIGLQGSLFND